ncbi:MAG: hypothetical protein ABSH14_17185 [Verrucomicrobiia bacterium]
MWDSHTNFIGDFGEVVAMSWLRESGYRICRGEFVTHVGHTLWRRVRDDDVFFGYGHALTKTLWDEDKLPELECQKLNELAGNCFRMLKCGVSGTPCQNAPSEFFAECKDSRFECTEKLTYLAVTGRCAQGCEIASCPIKAQLQIEHFILALHEECHRNPALTSWFEHWKGAPGRIDLFAAKEGRLHALEIKTNSGQLNKWQAMRMAWLRQRGFEVGTVRVRLNPTDKEQLTKLYDAAERDAVEFVSLDDVRQALRPPPNLKLLHNIREACRRMRNELIAKALTICNPCFTIELFDPSEHEEVCRCLPTEEQIKMVAEARPRWRRATKWNDHANNTQGAPDYRLHFAQLCSRLLMPVESQSEPKL